MAVTHRIKRLEVALRVPDQELARDLQQEVSVFCRTELHELLQGAFDAIAPDRYIRIDYLELNLPAFANAGEFRDKLGERIRQALRIQLDDAEASLAAVTRTSSGAVVGEAPQRPLTFDTPYQAAGAFIHILKYGVRPWHAMTAAFDDVVHAVIDLLQTDQVFRIQLAAVLSVAGQALRRFILQTPTPDRCRIVSLITEIDEHLIADIERLLETFTAVLTHGAGPVPNTDLLVREISIRHLIGSRTTDNAVIGAMLDDVMTGLIDASGNEGWRIMDDLPLAGMEMETVLPRRWRQAIRDRIAAFAPAGSGPGAGGIAAAAQAPVGERTALSLKGGELPGAPQSKTVAGSIPDDSAIPGAPESKTVAGAIPDDSAIPVTPESKTVAGSIPDDSVVPGGRDNDVHTQRAVVAEDPVDRAARGASAAESIPEADRSFKAPAEDLQLAKDEQQQIVLPQTTEVVQPERSVPGKGIAVHAQEVAHGHLGSTDHNGVTPASSSRDSLEPARRFASTDDRPDPSAGLPWMTPYEAEEFHIDNAGLVLVAPFFGFVFMDLGYLDKGRDFVTEEARIRAVHFSQYLVASEQHPPECGLTLNKLLCGMQVDEPLERFIDLTEPERNAAGEVLDSALAHWAVLKRTSAPVFQQTFLQHEGILTKERTNWLLRIERISADVLIDTLPWTISIIKHPWMKQPVMVEW